VQLGVFAVFACTCSQFREGSAFGAAFSGFRRLCGLSVVSRLLSGRPVAHDYSLDQVALEDI